MNTEGHSQHKLNRVDHAGRTATRVSLLREKFHDQCSECGRSGEMGKTLNYSLSGGRDKYPSFFSVLSLGNEERFLKLLLLVRLLCKPCQVKRRKASHHGWDKSTERHYH